MILISDTTLRDGAQAEGISFSIDDKLQIVKELDELGIHWIEAGNPGANPLDYTFFKQLIHQPSLKNAHISAFGSTRRPYQNVSEDHSLQILCECPAAVKTIFGKCSQYQINHVLKCDEEENFKMIDETIHFLIHKQNHVWFDAEHFFDAYKENPEFALKSIKIAENAGAERIILCDTNGGALPNDIKDALSAAKEQITVPLGIHCHNDCGLAVANSLTAILNGCDLIQGTISGIGERCGNADLCTLIPLVTLKLKKESVSEHHLTQLTHVSHVISEIMNITPNENAPFVGFSAFAHKGGMHIDAIIKDHTTYEHIDPESVGNQRRFLISDQSGSAGIYARLNKILPELNRTSPEIISVVNKLKSMEAEGYTYENADGSFELLALDTLGKRPRYFEVRDYHVLCQQGQGAATAQAYLKVAVNGIEGINAAEGDGPVNALDLALRKTLSLFYPSIKKMRLQDFKVRVINSHGTASKVRVAIESTDGVHQWKTVGVHDNIILASLIALIDSVDYMLNKYVSEDEINAASQINKSFSASKE